MKKAIFLFLLILFSCTNNNQESIEKPTKIDKDYKLEKLNNHIIIDSIWIEDFRIFRQALYQDNYNVIENYIEFPLNNDSWYLVLGENYSGDYYDKKMSREEFKKYYKKIFTSEFTKSILSIKSEDLFLKEEVISNKLTLVNKYLYKAIICHKLKSDNITMGLGVESEDQLNSIDDIVLNCNEISTQYYFKIDSSSHLKFKGIYLTG